MVGRAEHRRTTLLALSDAAIDLFEAEGSRATVEAIAERAGVSRRTVFRYVDGKEELAFIHPVLWFDVFDRALAAVDDRPLVERLQLASRAIAHHIDADPGPPRRAFTVAAANPELIKGYSSVFHRWIDRVAEEVLAASDPTDPGGPFRARIVGSAVMGMVDAVTRRWVFAPDDVRFIDLYDEGFAILTPLLTALEKLPGSGPIGPAPFVE